RHRRLNLFGALSTAALLMKSVSMSAPSWRACAPALSMIFGRAGARLLLVNWSSWIASAASRPRTRSAIIRALRGEIRENLALALLLIRDLTLGAPSRTRLPASGPAARAGRHLVRTGSPPSWAPGRVPSFAPVSPTGFPVIRGSERPSPRHRG